MSYFRLNLSVAAIAGLTLLMTPIASRAADGPSAERGYETYMRIGCFQCHGTVGQGPISGPRLAPNPLPVEAIRAYIRAPAEVMPPYVESVLSDAEVADIHAYLESIPEGPNVEDTILGD
jgi:ubiquinol-cytochrome c reductase cytochrome c subunit